MNFPFKGSFPSEFKLTLSSTHKFLSVAAFGFEFTPRADVIYFPVLIINPEM